MATYVLDACALIAYLRDEPGADHISDIFDNMQHTVLIHAITLGEVYYDTHRFSGVDNAQQVLKDILSLPVTVIRELSDALLTDAGNFKASNRISYADSFVLALAQQKNAVIVTSDHHEFEPIDENTSISFLWIR